MLPCDNIVFCSLPISSLWKDSTIFLPYQIEVAVVVLNSKHLIAIGKIRGNIIDHSADIYICS